LALDIDIWRERIRYGKKVMEEKGLLGDRTGGDRMIRDLIAMYRGEPEAHLPLGDWFEEEQRVMANKIFAVANQLESECAASDPTAKLYPRGGITSSEAAARSAANARLIEPLIAYDIQALDFGSQFNDALVDHFFAPCGWIRAGFTPRDEVFSEDERRQRSVRLNPYASERPDRPWIRRWAPWDVVPDPDCYRFNPDGGMRWVAFRSIMTLEEIKKNPGMSDVKGLNERGGNVAHPFRPMDEQVSTYGTEEGDPDRNRYVEVFTVYEAIERTWFQITLDGPTGALRKQDDWPIPWEWLPVRALVVNQQRDTPWGVPLLANVYPIQRELNRLRTMMSWLVNNIRRLIVVSSQGMEEGEKRKLESAMLTEILESKGSPREVIQAVQTGGFPQELLQYEQLLEEDIRENLGISRMGRGQRINVESATEAGFVQDGQDVNVDRVIRKYEKFWKDGLFLHLQGRRATFSDMESELYPLVGKTDVDGLVQWAQITASELHGDFDFEIVPGSTRRRSRRREEAEALMRLQQAAQLGDIANVSFYVMKWVEAQGVNPEEALNNYAQMAGQVRGVQEMRRQAGAPELQGGGGGGGNGANPAAIAALLQNAQSGGQA
jgi:hypothetical protein